MREELAKLRNIRKSFKGTFVRFGLKSGYKGPLKTVLLKDIINVNSDKVITDHLWFNLTKGFERLQLQEGDIVSFDARVTTYLKGYRGRREDELRPVEIDYRLSFPTKVEKLCSVLHNVAAPQSPSALMAINKRFKDEVENKEAWSRNKTLDSYFNSKGAN